MLTALTIYLFHVAKFFVAFLRFSQRAFWPKRFLCPLALFSAIQKIFTYFCLFVLGQGPSARDTHAGVWRAGAAPSGVCGGLLLLVLLVRVSRAVLCRSVPRRVASCCGALHCGAL